MVGKRVEYKKLAFLTTEQLGLELCLMTDNRTLGFSSRSIHAGYQPDPYMGSILSLIHISEPTRPY